MGILVADDGSSSAAAFGVKGIEATDTLGEYRALAADVNAHGGVLGRKLVIVPYKFSSAAWLADPSTTEQAACTYFTQDQPVFAVLNGSTAVGLLVRCVAKSRITNVVPSQFVDADAARASRLFSAAGMSYDKLAPILVARLAAQGYFSGWDTARGQPSPAVPVKVGLVYGDFPQFRKYNAHLRALLTARHIAMAPDFVYTANSAQDAVTGNQAAVLKFREEGVTHVFAPGLTFYQTADSQQYHPRYGFDSQVPPALLAQNVGASQLHGSLGIGWTPTWDVEAAQDPGDVSPQQTRCRKVLTEAGFPTPTQRTGMWGWLAECETVFALASALKMAGAPDPDRMAQGFAALGDYDSVMTFHERWRVGSPASANVVSDLSYKDNCSCFSYDRAKTAL